MLCFLHVCSVLQLTCPSGLWSAYYLFCALNHNLTIGVKTSLTGIFMGIEFELVSIQSLKLSLSSDPIVPTFSRCPAMNPG